MNIQYMRKLLFQFGDKEGHIPQSTNVYMYEKMVRSSMVVHCYNPSTRQAEAGGSEEDRREDRREERKKEGREGERKAG
jgi:hypothetical protein